MLTTEGGNSIGLTNLALDGSGIALPAHRGLVHCLSGRDIRITDCEIVASGGNGIWLENVAGDISGNIITKTAVTAVTSFDAQGLADDVISQILEDDYGWLWFGSRRGLFKVRKHELADCAAGRLARVTPILFGRSDGLSGLSAVGSYQPTAWKSRNGDLWFVTRKGLVRARPDGGFDTVSVRTGPAVPLSQTLSSRAQHEDALRLATQSMTRFHSRERRNATVTMALSEATAERMRARLVEMERELVAMAEHDPEPRLRVYALAWHWFPVTNYSDWEPSEG